MIRQETPKDYETVYEVVRQAFACAEHSDGNEQDLVTALRKSDAFVPELSLVAEQDGKIVGYILFTKIDIGGRTALALAPLAVLPAYQRQGIGSALIREGHRIAGALGYPCSVVLGSEKYYPRFGYVPADRFGIRLPFDVPAENFMAIRLTQDAPSIRSTDALPIPGTDALPIRGADALPIQGTDALPIQGTDALPIQGVVKYAEEFGL